MVKFRVDLSIGEWKQGLLMQAETTQEAISHLRRLLAPGTVLTDRLDEIATPDLRRSANAYDAADDAIAPKRKKNERALARDRALAGYAEDVVQNFVDRHEKVK